MQSEPPTLDTQPGFRRRFLVTPTPGQVRADLEDDYHCMSVTIIHENGVATAIQPAMHRAPWDTCPGAEAVLKQTFTGVKLTDFAVRGAKKSNCTHLHDLATLAAAHATDTTPLVYDVLTSDPEAGENRTELRRNGKTLHEWTLANGTIVAPADIAGMTLLTIQPFLERLDDAGREAVRILRWGTMIANGRTLPVEDQSDARQMPPNCYTFQPDIAARAERVGVIRDFSTGAAKPLDGSAV
jgi:hypothetical protein